MLDGLGNKLKGDLRTSWRQLFAVWLVILLGTTFYGATYPAAVNLLESFLRTYDRLKALDYDVQVATAGPEAVALARTVPGVAGVEGRWIAEGKLAAAPGDPEQLGLRLISVPDDREPEVSRSEVVEGRPIQASGEVLLLQRFARRRGLRPGDALRAELSGQVHDLRVAGLVFNPEYLQVGRSPRVPIPTSSFGVAWLRASDLARMTGRAGQLNDLLVRLDENAAKAGPDAREAVRRALAAKLSGYQDVVIYSRSETVTGSTVDAQVGGMFPLLAFFSGIFLVGAAVVTAILLMRLIGAQRQQIGTMRAMGVTRGELLQHYLLFGLILGATGGLAGSLLGYANSAWILHLYVNNITGGGALPGFVNVPQLPFILGGYAVGVATSTAAGAYPAWVESGTHPGIALRPATPKPPSALSRRALRWLPLSLRQLFRNLLRVPSRSLGTALGVIAGATMMFSALTLWDSLDATFEQFFSINQYDLRVELQSVREAGALEAQVKAIPGVAGAQPLLLGPLTVTGPDGSTVDTVLAGVDERDPFLRLPTLEGAPALSSANGVWIGHNLARLLGIKPGAVGGPRAGPVVLRLRAAYLDREVQVLGVVAQAVGRAVFVPSSLVKQWVPGGFFPASSALVRVQPGQERSVRLALSSLSGAVAVEVNEEFEQDIRDYLMFYRTGILICGAFGLILTLAVLLNAVNVNLGERRQELAILRSLGITRREIARTVTLENLSIVIAGLLVGVPLGRAVGFRMSAMWNTAVFGMLPQVRPLSYVAGTAGLLAIVWLAQIPGLRAVQRVDLGQVSKSQSL